MVERARTGVRLLLIGQGWPTCAALGVLALLLLLLTACDGAGGSGLIGGGGPLDDDDDDVSDDDDATLPPDAGDVVINEVRSTGGDPIELFNRSDDTFDLTGWALVDDDWSHEPFMIPDGTELEPDEFIVFFAEETHIAIGDEDKVRLLAPGGTLAEEVDWDVDEAKISLCRYPDGAGWTECTMPTPGEPNSMEEIPGAGDVVINEVRSTDGDRVELYNRSSAAVDLGGWSLVDDNDLHAPYVIPDGMSIEPGGFLVFNNAQTGLGFGYEDAAILMGPGGVPVDEAAWTGGEALISWCRYPDGADDAWDTCTMPTPGAPNTMEYSGVQVDPLWIGGLDRAHDVEVEVDEPNELAFDLSGKLWAGDQDNLRVQVFDQNGAFVGSVGGNGSGPGQFTPRSNGNNQGPEQIKPGNDGIIYVVDRLGRRINRYDSQTLAPLESIGGGGPLVDPCGMAVDSTETIYIGDQNTNQIHVFSATGEHLDTFDYADAWGVPILSKIETIAIDEPNDLLFGTSEYEALVEVYRLSTGEYLGQNVTEPRDPGGDQIQPGRITVSIEGIGTDQQNGYLFIADEQAGRIMIHDIAAGPALFDPAEDYAFRGAFSSSSHFAGVDGVYADPVRDRVAIADQVNSRVQVFLLSEIYTALGLD